MRAIEITQPGGPEVLQITDWPEPVALEGEVLIDVVGAGVNRPDVLQRLGLYDPPPGASDLPGLEVSGHRRDTGAAVCALCNGGGYAGVVAVPTGQLLPVPENVSVEDAGALPETTFTVWHNLVQRGGLVRDGGQRVLIHGGSSGIGTIAIQLAKAWGAEVFTTVGSGKKQDYVRALGADHAINYREQDFAALSSEMDIILDMVSGDYVARNLSCLAVDGRLLTIAVQGGRFADGIDMARLMIRRQSIIGSTLRPQSDAQKSVIAQGVEQDIWPLLADGAIRLHIAERFALADASAAHAAMESGSLMGKLLLTANS